MNNELDIDNLGEEELASAKKVIDVKRADRQGETITQAFVNRIEETLELGDTGYTREVIFPIPLELINEDGKTQEFIKAVGRVSRKKELGLPVAMEEDTVDGIKIMSLVIVPTDETDIKGIVREFDK